MFRIQLLGIIATSVGLLATPVSASPSSSHAVDPGRGVAGGTQHPAMDGLALNGTGSLSWFGLRIYDATLWSEAQELGGEIFDQRVALRIQYHRSVDAERLVRVTREEWRNLDDHMEVPDQTRTEAWLAQAGSIWPDVGPGDFILTIVEPDGETRFYGPDGLLGVIDDPAFGPAFLSIWLHPRTSRPELRSALLGDPVNGA